MDTILSTRKAKRSAQRSSRTDSINPPETPLTSVTHGESEDSSSPAVLDEGPKLPATAEGAEAPNNPTNSPVASNSPPDEKNEVQNAVHSTNQASNSTQLKPSGKPGEEIPTKNQDTAKDNKNLNAFTASKSSPLWDKYIKITEEIDKDELEDWEGFVLESSKNLQPDPTGAAILAIQELTSVMQAGFQTPRNLSAQVVASLGTSFRPSTITVWVNCLWYFSLGLSISVSLLSMLAKRWCYQARSRHLGTPYERAVERQKNWDRLEKWKLELFIEHLPTAMHVALMTFFIGLVLYLSEIHSTTMIVTAIPIGFTILAYLALTAVPMGTPLASIMRAGIESLCQLGLQLWSKVLDTQIWLKIRNHALFLEVVKLMNTMGCATKRATYFVSTMAKATPITPSVSSKDWAITGRSQFTGKTEAYPCSEEQQYPFRALLWLLQSSNDKKLIDDILEYVTSFPEVVLDSVASSQELTGAAMMIVGHFDRLNHDAVEYHDLKQFSAKCGRFIYLLGRPWLHYSDSTADRFIFGYLLWRVHGPLMGAKEVETQLNVIEKKKLSDSGCILWLERQAATILLGCEPDEGFKLSRALYQSARGISGDLNSQELKDLEEIHTTIAWIFLNIIADASIGHTFWPTHSSQSDSEGAEETSALVAKCDGKLTLTYFRHSETRKSNSVWLRVVGFSGILYVPTCYPCEETRPNSHPNKAFYKNIVDTLRTALPTHDQLSIPWDSYTGMLPVYWQSQVRLFELDSLHYCFAALDHASELDQFAELHGELEELKRVVEGALNHLKSQATKNTENPVSGDDISITFN